MTKLPDDTLANIHLHWWEARDHTLQFIHTETMCAFKTNMYDGIIKQAAQSIMMIIRYDLMSMCEHGT